MKKEISSSGWIKWYGDADKGNCPVNPDLVLEVLSEDFSTCAVVVSNKVDWSKTFSYRVVSVPKTPKEMLIAKANEVWGAAGGASMIDRDGFKDALQVACDKVNAMKRDQTAVLNKPATKAKASDRQEGGSHYKEMGVEPWDVVDTWPIEQQVGYHRGALLKYTMRLGSKDERLKEAKKIAHYAQKLVEVLGG